MIDYARIGKMLEYSKTYGTLWNGDSPTLKRRLKDIAKILLNRGPVTTPYGRSDAVGGMTDIFRIGTRGWEYPWVLEQLAGLPNGSKVLDCGCGVSDFPRQLHLRGFRAVGLDFFVGKSPSRPGYGITQSHINYLKGQVEFISGTLDDIPTPDNTFDVVTCISVMEHIVIEHRGDPTYHLKCLDEMRRVLRVGGLLVCTYDTVLNEKVVYGGTAEWGETGWCYLNDIDYLLTRQMRLKDPTARRVTREEISRDEDAFFVPPDLYFALGFGSGFDLFGPYHRMTSVGFALIKE